MHVLTPGLDIFQELNYLFSCNQSLLISSWDLKILDQNNWGGPKQKIKLRGELNLRADLKFYGGPMNPNDVMVVMLKDVLLYWLDSRFIYIVYISWYYI